MLVPFGCFVVRSKETQTPLHAWDLLAKYYESKHGKEFTNSATNKLSQSFSLNVVAGKVITIKQSLLNAVETVLKIHKYDTSNKDSCFKAFVCLALKLVLSSFLFSPFLFVYGSRLYISGSYQVIEFHILGMLIRFYFLL